MTSVSRSDQNDEADAANTEADNAEAATTGAAKSGAAKSGAAKTGAAKTGAARAGSAKTGAAKTAATKAAATKRAPAAGRSTAAADETSAPAKTTAAKTPRARTTTPRTTTAKTAAGRAAASKGAASRAAETSAETSATEPAAPEPTVPEAAERVAAGPEAAEPAASSKRTPASRTASKSASTARGQAAKAVRSTAEKGAASSATARARAAETTAKKRQTPRAAAALTTETTAAERPRKTDATGEPEYRVDEPGFPGDIAAVAPAAAAAAAAAAAEAERSAEPERPAEAAVEAAPVVAPEPLETSVVGSEPASGSGPEPVAASEPAVAELPPVAAQTDPEPGDIAADTSVAVVAAPPKKPAPRKKRTLRVARPAPGADVPAVLQVENVVKRFGANTAVDHISLEVRAGSFFGVVGPNGAGKTTTLSMVTGLLRPDEGTVRIHDIDVWADPKAAKRATGVLPDRLRLFDRLTGAQLLDYSGTLRGLDHRTVRERAADLAAAFGLEDALGRLVADYSAGMTKKIALACAMIHSPRLLVLDEPFESVDPVSAANLTEILERYVAGGGTVVLSSHGMDLIERVCDSAAIVVGGKVLAHGTLDEVRQGQTLEDRFVELAGGRKAAEGMEWLHSFSD